ncbi:DUF2147 domain-containing protein [Qipengyuania gaetbuli]|uniref:DUF2147 domain-containing protein n=1 Tax=Qipengyuania gaetbuli TaxID=266952 RepID=UPI001CD57867|nr:DUF2147 domain-containing protein [Qipengyuania gaetbuli]MCA0909910.1 DUF2147 domain-containing protein [Qipengyuania gaetbuli]
MRKTSLALAALLCATPLLAAQPIEGRWITAEKDAVITIGECGSSTCGRITKFLVAPPQGLDQRDVNNADAKLRQRKLLGMPVLTGFSEDAELWRGQIYDPKSGKTYRSVIRRKDANRLEVKGCIGPFCQTQVWTRAR